MEKRGMRDNKMMDEDKEEHAEMTGMRIWW